MSSILYRFLMRSPLAVLLLLVSLSSCSSPTESKGVDAVLAFYGGVAQYSKGVKTTTKDELQGRYYQLQLSGVAERLQQKYSSFKLPASNCAYLFYQALAPEEKEKYSFIRIIIDGNNTTTTYDYPVADLAKVAQAMALIRPSVAALQQGDYARFLGSGSPLTAPPAEWANMESGLQDVDTKYGRVQDFSLQGFTLQDVNLASGVKHLVALSGVLVRAQQSTDFQLVVEPTAAAQSSYLYGFNFTQE